MRYSIVFISVAACASALVLPELNNDVGKVLPIMETRELEPFDFSSLDEAAEKDEQIVESRDDSDSIIIPIGDSEVRFKANRCTFRRSLTENKGGERAGHRLRG
jgi:hypothetical protein